MQSKATYFFTLYSVVNVVSWLSFLPLNGIIKIRRNTVIFDWIVPQYVLPSRACSLNKKTSGIAGSFFVSVKQSAARLKAGSVSSSFCSCSAEGAQLAAALVTEVNLCGVYRLCFLFYDPSAFFVRRQASGNFSLHLSLAPESAP